MKVSFIRICLYTTVFVSACQLEESNYNARYQANTDAFRELSGYNLLEPTQSYILPETLTEISGLATLNDSTVACVEDESGVIFLYSLSKDKMLDHIRFSGPGDYEGIEIIGDHAYVLKSNGNLYEYSFKDQTTNTIKTPLKRSNNAEGLTYDSLNNRILIVLKGGAGLDKKELKGRAIYSYHLSTGFNSDPAYLIKQEDLHAWNDKQTDKIRFSKSKTGFMPSGIAIHPITKEIYMVATVGKLLIVLDPSGEIKHCVRLSPRVFRQPEGICFTSNGDLIISNEGQDGNGKIQLFVKD